MHCGLKAYIWAFSVDFSFFKKSDFDFEISIHVSTPAKCHCGAWKVVGVLESGCLHSILGIAVHRRICNSVFELLSEQQTQFSVQDGKTIKFKNRTEFDSGEGIKGDLLTSQ